VQAEYTESTEILFSVCSVLSVVNPNGISMSKATINTPAPDFELTDFTGKTLRLSDFRGKANVLLVFNRGFM